MDKLFKLLELYICERGGKEKFVLRGGQIHLIRKNRFHNQHQYDTDCIIISKRFGFVRWLVENNKIDLDMVREKLGIPCCVWYGSGRIIAVKDVEDYRQILMLLSISDTAIDDLISYLK